MWQKQAETARLSQSFIPVLMARLSHPTTLTAKMQQPIVEVDHKTWLQRETPTMVVEESWYPQAEIPGTFIHHPYLYKCHHDNSNDNRNNHNNITTY